MRWCVLISLCVACSNKSKIAVLGNGTGEIADLISVEAVRSDGLGQPNDLAFNPERPDELWIVNKGQDSVVIYENGTTTRLVDPFALHFMEKVTSIAFGPGEFFATCQDGQNTYNGSQPGNGFTGPTLWSSDPAIFAQTNPDAVDFLEYDLGSHLDMLHESPECMGIAWESENVYWVYDGFNGDVVRYDFAEDHGAGYDDHCDGDIQRWTGLDLLREENVVSHMEYDAASRILYLVDAGNGRILALDTTSGARGRDFPSVEDGACRSIGYDAGPAHYGWRDGVVTELITGLDKPAGLALIEDTLFITEHGSGAISAYDLEGTFLDGAETGQSGLQGITGTMEQLWVVDSASHELLSITTP